MLNGTYRVSLYKGNIRIVRRDLPTSLFSPEIRSIKSSGFNQQACQDAAKIRGLPFEILAKQTVAMERFVEQEKKKRKTKTRKKSATKSKKKAR